MEATENTLDIPEATCERPPVKPPRRDPLALDRLEEHQTRHREAPQADCPLCVKQQKSRPKAAPRQVAAGGESGYSEPMENAIPAAPSNGSAPVPEAEGEQLSYPPPPPSTPPPKRNQQRAFRSYFRDGVLDAFFPSAERIKFWKRLDSGHVGYVGEYGAKDLDSKRDIESFIQAYLLPRFGEGTYEVQLINSNGVASKKVEYVVLSPAPAASAAPPVAPQVSSTPPSAAANRDPVLEFLLRQQEKSQEQNRPPTLTEQVQQLKALKETFGEGRSDGLLLYMLMQYQQPKGPDPAVLALQQQMAELSRKVEQIASAPPPLPPPPPPEQKESVLDVIRAIKELQPPPSQSQGSVFEKVVTYLPHFENLLARITGKEELEALLSEILEMKKEQQQHGFKTMIENIRALQEVARESAFPESDNFGVEFLRFLRQTFSKDNYEALGNLADRLRGRIQEKPAIARPQTRPVRSQRLMGVTPQSESAPQLPQKFLDAVKLVRDSVETDDTQRITSTVNALFVLAQSDAKFEKWTKRLRYLAKAGSGKDKDSASEAQKEILDTLDQFFDGLILQGLLDESHKEAVMRSFRGNITTVCEEIAKLEA